MSLPSLAPRGLASHISSTGFSVPRSASSSALARRSGKQRDWTPKRVANGSPYAVNFTAECERIEEEHRVRNDFENRRRKLEDRERERLRKEIIEQARAEEARVHRLHQQKIAIMEEQKRLKALRGVKMAEERYKREKSDIHRRFYDPTTEVVQQREREWEQRKAQRLQNLQDHMKKVETINEMRRQEDLQMREARRVSAPRHPARTATSVFAAS